MFRFREVREINETRIRAQRNNNGIPVFEKGFDFDPDERVPEKDPNIPKFAVHELAVEIDPDERIPVREAAEINADERPVLEAAAM